MLRINDVAPNFTAGTTGDEEEIDFHNWIGDRWALLWAHPKAGTPVSETELVTLAAMEDRFLANNCRIIGISPDDRDDLRMWLKEVNEYRIRHRHDAAIVAGWRALLGADGWPDVAFPLISDPQGAVAKAYGLIITGRVASLGPNPGVGRAVYLINPRKKIKAALAYSRAAGINFEEVARLLQATQVRSNHPRATPSGWQQGDPVLAPPKESHDPEAEWTRILPNTWAMPL